MADSSLMCSDLEVQEWHEWRRLCRGVRGALCKYTQGARKECIYTTNFLHTHKSTYRRWRLAISPIDSGRDVRWFEFKDSHSSCFKPPMPCGRLVSSLECRERRWRLERVQRDVGMLCSLLECRSRRVRLVRPDMVSGNASSAFSLKSLCRSRTTYSGCMLLQCLFARGAGRQIYIYTCVYNT